MATKAEKDKALRIAYRDCFSSEQGKVVLDDLMRNGFFFSSGFVPGDPTSTAYNLGVASVVQEILHKIGETQLPDWYIEKRAQLQLDSLDPFGA